MEFEQVKNTEYFMIHEDTVKVYFNGVLFIVKSMLPSIKGIKEHNGNLLWIE